MITTFKCRILKSKNEFLQAVPCIGPTNFKPADRSRLYYVQCTYFLTSYLYIPTISNVVKQIFLVTLFRLYVIILCIKNGTADLLQF